jgi:hypothetical protein
MVRPDREKTYLRPDEVVVSAEARREILRQVDSVGPEHVPVITLRAAEAHGFELALGFYRNDEISSEQRMYILADLVIVAIPLSLEDGERITLTFERGSFRFKECDLNSLFSDTGT